MVSAKGKVDIVTNTHFTKIGQVSITVSLKLCHANYQFIIGSEHVIFIPSLDSVILDSVI
jgi:hypothetical protein